MRPEVVELGPTKEDSRETFTAMDRRSFFSSMVGGIATAAAVRTWPFRVFSFPSGVELASRLTIRIVRAYDIPVAAAPPSETVLYVDREVISAEQMYRYFVASQVEMLNASRPPAYPRANRNIRLPAPLTLGLSRSARSEN